MAEWHEVHVRVNANGKYICSGDQQEWPCHTVQAFRYGQSLGEQTGRFGRQILHERDPNVLARQLADALDSIAELREELNEAAGTAAKWRRWAEDHDYVRQGLLTPEAIASFDFDVMIPEADALLEKVKDEAYERGEAEGLRTARNLLEDAVSAYGKEHKLMVY